MEKTERFERCVSCFAPQDTLGRCEQCGYDSGGPVPSGCRLPPGTILKGRYVLGRLLNATESENTYLGWDLQLDMLVEAVEYFPESCVTRDAARSESVSCLPGREEALEKGRQAFFEKVRLYYQCVSRLEEVTMDFFFRNNTCYYVRNKKK